MIDRRHIGHTMPPFSVEVEKGRLRFFAKATGQDDPVSDEAYPASRPGVVWSASIACRLAGRSLMTDMRTFREPAAQQNPRFGKRLDREIYVASEPSATPLQSYAPLSNFSPLQRVAPPWTPGIQVLSSPDFPLPQACAAAFALAADCHQAPHFRRILS